MNVYDDEWMNVYDDKWMNVYDDDEWINMMMNEWMNELIYRWKCAWLLFFPQKPWTVSVLDFNLILFFLSI